MHWIYYPLRGWYLLYMKEYITLDGKEIGGIEIHPIVEICSIQGHGGCMIQVVPAALVIKAQGKLYTHLINSIKKSDEQSAG